MTRNLEVKTEKERWNPGGLPKIRTRLYRILIFLISPQTGLPTEVFIWNQRTSLVSVPFMISLWCGNLNCIVPNLFDGFQQKGPRFGVGQFYKTDWFVKRRFCQFCNVFHIANLFYMVDNFMHKSNLFLIQRLVVNERRKRLHCRIVIQLYHFSDQ